MQKQVYQGLTRVVTDGGGDDDDDDGGDDDDDDDDEYLRVVIAKNCIAKRQAARFDCTTFLCDVIERRSMENNQRFE